MNINELKGTRCLLKVSTGRYGSQDVTEYRVLEISPSGNWVKIQNINGAKFWKPVPELALVEKLTELRAEPPPSA
jgi:hypothetical protein